MTRKIIKLADHPHNRADPTGTVVLESRYPYWVIFRCRAGYIVAIGDGMAFAETFPFQSVALAALAEYLAK